MNHINISEKALDRLKMKLLNSLQKVDIGFRMEIVGDDSSDLTLNIRLDKKRAGDEVYEKDGIKLFLDPESNFPFEEYHLDYEDGLDEGFTVKSMQEV